MRRSKSPPIAGISGLLLVLVALFAAQLGLDNDAGWGGGRLLILKAGIALLVLEVFLRIFREFILNIQGRISTMAGYIGRDRSLLVVFAASVLLTAAAYNWFLRDAGDAGIIYNYYSELARGFKRGNLYLSQEPSTRLLALEDPYDPVLRKQAGVEDFPWDVSLYEGRFYIYWGPVPAAALMPFNDAALAKIEDFHLALVYAFGLFVYSAWIAASFWRSLKNAPVWAFAILSLVFGFSIPTTVMLGRGEVYEAAIFASQFFFIGGCYWAYSSMRDEAPPAWKFAMASAHWALAIGSRALILPAVAAAMLVMIYPILSGFLAKNRAPADWGMRLRLLSAAGIPLLAGVSALAWYNHARFDSILEFGIRYQLANVNYTRFDASFGARYLLENLKIYFLEPVVFQPRFPYLLMSEYQPSNSRIAGLFYAAPFIVLILLPLVRSIFAVRQPAVATQVNKRRLALFAGAALASAAAIFFFYFIALRYTLDFLPSALILIALSLGMEYESLGAPRPAGKALSLIFIVLALANVTMGVLLAFPPEGKAFMLNLLNALGKLLGVR